MPITRRRRANQPDQPENNNHAADQTESATESLATEQTPTQEMPPPDAESTSTPTTESTESMPLPPFTFSPQPPSIGANGDRGNGGERQDYTPIEGGRRTARGELFRRPPQPPPVGPPPPQPAQLQAPTHEISLPLGNLLHLAYNPAYTGADEARSLLLHRLAEASKTGGRARCWNCGSLAVVYDRWSTRSKTFGEIGIAYCEICGVWSVM